MAGGTPANPATLAPESYLIHNIALPLAVFVLLRGRKMPAAFASAGASATAIARG
jgi:hypothetical protein